MVTTSPKVFLITGVSSGLGYAFAKQALADGHTVVGTVRNESAKDEFEQLDRNRAVGVLLDVTDFPKVDATVQIVTAKVGEVDVLVNNAGYGQEGTLEESSIEDLERQFAVNVFGPVAMIKAVLPSMRKRRTGHIFNVTSLAGYAAPPGVSFYSGSKFALEGISEALAEEVKDFGIHVTAIAPGAFRTDWAGRSLVRTERSISDYDRLFDPIREARRNKDGKQPGDPARAARVLLELIECDSPPVHLLIGRDALAGAKRKIARLSSEIGNWEDLSLSTDFAA